MHERERIVAINYLPAEEPDVQEVMALIKKEGRKAVAIRVICAKNPFASNW